MRGRRLLPTGVATSYCSLKPLESEHYSLKPFQLDHQVILNMLVIWAKNRLDFRKTQMSNSEKIEDQSRRKGKNMVVAKLEKPDLVNKYYYFWKIMKQDLLWKGHKKKLEIQPFNIVKCKRPLTSLMTWVHAIWQTSFLLNKKLGPAHHFQILQAFNPLPITDLSELEDLIV